MLALSFMLLKQCGGCGINKFFDKWIYILEKCTYVPFLEIEEKKKTLSEMPQNNEISICFNQSDTENEYNMHMQYEKFSI